MSYLTLNSDEDDPYSFDSFCRQLSHFPNVSHLELESIYLSDSIEEQNTFKLPKLVSLNCWGLESSFYANLLRNELLDAYSDQLESIRYDEKYTCRLVRILLTN